MKGIILAGGTGSRLYPLTKVTNKHLLPVFNKPMIYYPLYSLKKAGITNVMIVSGKGHCGDFLELLGSGSQFGMKISYEVQEEAGGIAQALGLAKDFANNEKVIVLLGDNVIEEDISGFVSEYKTHPRGAKILLKEVSNPSSYGVVEIDGDKIVNIEEKPKKPKSNLVQIGCYMYDPQVFDIIEGLKPSDRNELEITDVNNFYMQQGTLTHDVLEGFWADCGESFDSLIDASKKVRNCHLADVDEYLNIHSREHKDVLLDNKENAENNCYRLDSI